MTHDGDHGASVTEIRVLEGPNLYFNRPAAKVTLHLPAYLAVGADQLQALGRTLGVRRSEAGEPNTEARQRFVLRLVERVVRLLVRETGLTRLGVRVRPGTQLDEIIIAFALNSRGRAQAVGDALEPMLRSLLTHAGQGPALREAADAIRQQPVGEKLRPMRPKIPVVSVTGTNGKTTTTRLIAHLGMTAGLRTGWSSTDGVLVQGELIASGDYSGPGGARTVLQAPGVQFAVLETARGGMLQKGLGTAYNDVSVVTNVSADHLGLHGIETVDQLAEVKAIITKVTKPDGWVVLNGDDPRVWAMRSNASGKPWCFSVDPDSPSLREALDDHGRGITVMDGDIVLLLPGSSPDRLLAIRDVPVTLAGLSEQNVQNVLAATAAALGAGLPREAVVEGLRSFAPDSKHNPGRMNIYTLPLGGGGRATVILDMAHNEAGLDALLRVADGLRPPGAQLQLGLGTGGDRTDEILVNMGEQAGLHADRVQVVHKAHYLRGRTMENLEGFLRQGLSRAGMTPTASWRNELDGLHGLISACHDGDVLALMTHSDWQQLHTWLLTHGATSDTPATIRRKVTVARGEHEAETELQQLWQDDDAERRIVTAQALRARFPRDGRVLYELAGTHDSAGHEAEALKLYDGALRAGLPEPYHHRALIQKASTLRHLARLDESLGVLDELLEQYPDNAAVVTFRALTLHDLGRDEEALRSTAEFLVATSADADVARYHRSLTRFTAAI